MRTKEQIKWIFDKVDEVIQKMDTLNSKKDKHYYSIMHELYNITNFLIMCNEYEEEGVFINFDDFRKNVLKIKNMQELNKPKSSNNIMYNEYIKGFNDGLSMINTIFLNEKA